jgi:hypothetical protein
MSVRTKSVESFWVLEGMQPLSKHAPGLLNWVDRNNNPYLLPSCTKAYQQEMDDCKIPARGAFIFQLNLACSSDHVAVIYSGEMSAAVKLTSI